MQVKVSLLTILKRFASDVLDEHGNCSIPEGFTLKDLAGYIGIPDTMVKIFLVNGKPQHAPYVLRESDEVRIFSFVGGG